MKRFDHPSIAFMRDEEGLNWAEIAGRLGEDPVALRKAHSRWRIRKNKDSSNEPRVVQEWRREPGGTIHLKFPDPPVDEEAVRKLWDAYLDDAAEHAPRYDPPPRRKAPADAMLAVLNLYDCHFGLRADSAETNRESQDLDIISDDWRRAVDELVGMAQFYEVDRYLVPLGHDLSHVDHAEAKGAVTRSGTPQDVGDSRLWKIFTAMRQASVYLIDALRATGKEVDICMVRGNHDRDINSYLGETVAAWYRHDPGVMVDNSPQLRKFYGWGRGAWMLYHGELNRKKGLPHAIFATSCPAQMWVDSEGGTREILTGHFHKRETTRFIPEANEERAITLRSLPGLTSTDAWHSENGYLHKRAATLLMYRKQGGLYALHEFSP